MYRHDRRRFGWRLGQRYRKQLGYESGQQLIDDAV
jgi:hypothetical protein